MASPVRICNIVASIDLGDDIDVRALQSRGNGWERVRGLGHVRCRMEDQPNVMYMVFPGGKVIITGCVSMETVHACARRIEDVVRPYVRQRRQAPASSMEALVDGMKAL